MDCATKLGRRRRACQRFPAPGFVGAETYDEWKGRSDLDDALLHGQVEPDGCDPCPNCDEELARDYQRCFDDCRCTCHEEER